MYTAGRRNMQSHGLTQHIHRVKACWSARASTVVALAHSLFARSAARRLDVRLFSGGIMAGPARNMLPNFTGLGQGNNMNIQYLQRDVASPRTARNKWSLTLILLTRRASLGTAIAAAALFGTSLHAAGTNEEAPSGFPNIAQLANEKELPATSTQSKLDSQIVLALKQSRGEAPFDGRTALEPGIPITQPDIPIKDGPRVLIDLEATVSEELRTHIGLIGGQLAPSPDATRIIRAMIPLAEVEALAARADITFISPARLELKSGIYLKP